MKKQTLTIVLVAILFVGWLVGGVMRYQNSGEQNGAATTNGEITSNVSVVNGKQQIVITATQGYRPRTTIAKANIPTEIKIQWKNAYGCEAAVRIPQVNYSKIIDPTWSDIVQISPQKPGDTIYGSCSMGMYSFQIKFVE